LDFRKILFSLGHAATQAAGTVEVLGAQSRVLNAGFAARNGLAAARLAAEGLEGPARPLEGLRGFFNVFGGNNDFSALTGDLGKRWEMTNVAYKPYPCGVVLHALIDLCIESREKLKAAEKLTVSLHPLAIERTNRPEPKNALEARLSAQHAVAVALLTGRAGPAEFSDAAVGDSAIKAFRRRVTIVRDESLDKMAAILSDGKTTLRADAPKPMDDARLEAKFRGQAGRDAEKWLTFVDRLESMDRVALPD
jgi:2-methylcitrate dehydratase PrpD